MPQFETVKHVRHPPEQMFALVADVERYPEFVPLCERLTVRSRKERDGRAVLVAEMTVGYKAIRETFTSQVHLKPDTDEIDVSYLRWTLPLSEEHLALRPLGPRLRRAFLHRL